ncbi:MAG: DNA alkylation repair protein [Pseudomonadota bacterium]|nr:DNA alkylation repair protein [Pseudomonadota bacterium]
MIAVLTSHTQVAKKLQQRLVASGDKQKKAWYENYIKHNTRFWGVPLPQVEREFKLWHHEHNLADKTPDQLLTLAMHLLAQRHTEAKLAAILLLEKHVCLSLSWKLLSSKFRLLWERELIHDWYVCDAFCLRVLRKMLVKHENTYARHLIKQCGAPYVWQARSAVVPFVGNTETYGELVYAACARLIKRDERFAKTAVGWLLRELSCHDPDTTTAFLFKYRKHLTTEVMDNALKYFSLPHKRATKEALRAG